MKRLPVAFCLAAFAATLTTCRAESVGRFVSLFDGKSLDGWVGATDSFVAEDGVLATKHDRSGNLYSAKAYSDFVLRFEFRLSAGANNGVGLRAPLSGDAAFAGMECQVLDNTAPKYANLKPWQYHGSVYGVAAAKRGHLQPTGDWNTEEISCVGRRVRVTLNGEVIVDVDLDEAAPNGKTTDGREHPGLSRTEGHLGFLAHGGSGRVEFRAIEIAEVTPAQ